MVHTDKIVKDLELLHEGVFDLKELLNIIKEFFKRHDYDLTEKSYNSTTKDGLKTTVLKWDFDRKVDDYNQCFAKLSIELNNYKDRPFYLIIDKRFSIINPPLGVKMLSGWNCTPSTKNFLCLTPITTSLSLLALISSSSGIFKPANE